MHTWINCFFLLDYLGQSSLFASCSRKRGQPTIHGTVRSGIRGMEVRLGQPTIVNVEREGGNDGSKRWCGSLSSSSSEFLHHPFSFRQSRISREDKDGKNGVFEEEEEEEAPNTTPSSEMYSSASIYSRETFLRKGSWFNGGRCCNLLFPYNWK